jgi:hypothetical protein
MKQTAVEWYAEQAMLLEIKRATGSISITNMLNELSNILNQAKDMESKERLKHLLLIGKVTEILGFDKTVELLKECNKETYESNTRI